MLGWDSKILPSLSAFLEKNKTNEIRKKQNQQRCLGFVLAIVSFFLGNNRKENKNM